MKKTAGILLYRFKGDQPEFFLAHPGGPFWKNKDLGCCSIPKGEFTDEEPLVAAKREFKEETGFDVDGNFIPLTSTKTKGGKIIYAFALEADVDADRVLSNNFEMEFPPRSGKKASFPEIDRAAWFNIKEAREKINPSQLPLLEEVMEILKK